MGNNCDRKDHFIDNNPVPDTFVKIPGNKDLIDWILKVGGEELEECLVDDGDNVPVTFNDLYENFISLKIEVDTDSQVALVYRILSLLEDNQIHDKGDESIQFVMNYAKKFRPRLTVLNKDFVDALEKRIIDNPNVEENLEDQQNDKLEKDKEERKKKRKKALEKKNSKIRKKDDNNKVKKKFPSLSDQRKEIFLCSNCGDNFTTKQGLQRHEKIHTGKKDFSCSHCGFKCYRKDSLDRHIKRHHKDGQPGPSQSNFEPGPSQTEPVRLENRNWGCPCCSYSHKTKSVVIKHIKDVHLGNYIPS